MRPLSITLVAIASGRVHTVRMNKSLTALLAVVLGCASWQTAAFAKEEAGTPHDVLAQEKEIMWFVEDITTGRYVGDFDNFIVSPQHRVSNFSIHDIDTLRNGSSQHPINSDQRSVALDPVEYNGSDEGCEDLPSGKPVPCQRVQMPSPIKYKGKGIGDIL